MNAAPKCLLVASIFPPINGGSAVVYESLCRHAPPGTMLALAAWRNCHDGAVAQGWEQHDATAGYRIVRTELLRPLVQDAPASVLHSALRVLTVDIPLKVRIACMVAGIIRRERVNVVCIGELVSGSWIGWFAKSLFNCRVINYIHGEEITTVTRYRFYGRRRMHHLARADAVVAVSEFTRQALIRIMGVRPDKIELIPNGVDTHAFSPGPRDPELLRRFGATGKRVILTVGRIISRKGMDTMLKALPAIRQSVPNVHYLIVGEGPYRSELERLVRDLGLAECVTLTGKTTHDELVGLYRCCDIFAMPNREMPDGDTEGFGLVFLEANACGRAVIGGRAGGVVEAVRNGENGLLVDGQQVDEVARVTVTLLTDDTLRARLEARALEIAEASSSQVRALQFQSLCRRLLAG